MNKSINHIYPSNGRAPLNNDIKKYKKNWSSNKVKFASNGKIFEKKIENEYTNITHNKSNSKKNNFLSWIINTLNPLNHIPVVSSLNHLTKAESEISKSKIDIVQAAIGGAIYRGGAIGIAKGIGGWFLGKLLPKDFITITNVNKKKEINQIPNNGKHASVDLDHLTVNFKESKKISAIDRKTNTTVKEKDNLLNLSSEKKYKNIYSMFSNSKKTYNQVNKINTTA